MFDTRAKISFSNFQRIDTRSRRRRSKNAIFSPQSNENYYLSALSSIYIFCYHEIVISVHLPLKALIPYFYNPHCGNHINNYVECTVYV